MNEAEFKEIFKNFSEIKLNKNGFTVTFEKGTNIAEVYSKLTQAIRKLEIEEKTK